MVDSNIPNWLAARVNYAGRDTSSVAQDIQAGQQIAYRQQQMQQERQQMEFRSRMLALQEEAARLKVSATEFITKGSLELGQLMEEGGQKGIYHTDEFQGRLFAIGQRYPQLYDSDAFRGAAKVVENAKAAENRTSNQEFVQGELNRRAWAQIQARYELQLARYDAEIAKIGANTEAKAAIERLKAELTAEHNAKKAEYGIALEEKRQEGREAMEDKRQEGRETIQFMRDDASFEKMRMQLENSIKLQGVKQEDAKELKELQGMIDMERDARKIKTTSIPRLNLKENDRMLMRRELLDLGQWRRKNISSKADAEYDRRLAAIEAKFKARELPTGEPDAPTTQKVLKYNPSTKTFE